MNRFIKGGMLIMLLISLLSSCLAYNPKTETGEYRIDNVKIYLDTPAWELAKAVNNQDTKKIATIAEKTPEILDFQDILYGTNLLCWAVGMEKYKSAEALLKSGANPNIISTHEGGTALYLAAGYSYIDTQAKKDARFVKLLLKYGADPNIGFVGNDHNNSTEIGTTPLIKSIGCGIEKTKALVEAGANIDYKLPSGKTAAIKALSIATGARTKVSTELEVSEAAYYLIVEKQAKISEPYSILIANTDPIDVPTHYPVMYLRSWIFKLDSEGYKRKMEIVGEFARQGVDYWTTEIPKNQLEQIKKLYPSTWEEYIKRY